MEGVEHTTSGKDEGLVVPPISGRAAVRQILISRVSEAGMKPSRGQTQAALDLMFDRLAERLAHMSPLGLRTLADLILDEAIKPGAGQHRWPTELVVRSMAEVIEPSPLAEKRIVRSWLASIEGPKAEAGGYLVALYRWLRRHGRPVLPGDLRMTIYPEAERDRAQEARLRGYADRGTLRPDEAEWLVAYDADLAAARAIMVARQDDQEQQAGGEAA